MNTRKQGVITDDIETNGYHEPLSPVAINYLAAINSFRPRDLGDFDYCELGCGQGVSLLTHAATLPGGRFVGIDANPDNVARATALATASGLDNLRVAAATIADARADADLPAFDFITLHGLYTAVPEATRQDIQAFIRDRLKPGGMALVRYDALPGCAERLPLRDAMRRFALPLSSNPVEQAELALSYVRLMLNMQAPIFQGSPALADYAERLCSRRVADVAREFFVDDRHPLAVDRVAAEMKAAGLVFAGSMPLWHNHPEADVPANLAAFFAGLSDRLSREAHKDFIYNTAFRTDLYIRPEAGDAHRLDREAALWEMPFGAVTASDSVRLTINRGGFALPLNTREGRTIFSLVQDRPRTLAQLATAAPLAKIEPAQLVETVCWWVLSGQIRPAAPLGADSGARQKRCNAALLELAFSGGSEGHAWLASQRFGTAFRFDKAHALALGAVAGADDQAPEDALRGLMQRCGLSVEEDGRDMDAADLRALGAQLHQEMEADGALEHAARLGIID